jgi:hypothetical protein
MDATVIYLARDDFTRCGADSDRALGLYGFGRGGLGSLIHCVAATPTGTSTFDHAPVTVCSVPSKLYAAMVELAALPT